MDIRTKMRRDWDRRARDDARFWIATEDYRTEHEFAASGEATARALLERLPEAGREQWNVLEIGCGIGRVLRPLSNHFRSVVGVDVSEAMIDQSRSWLAGIPNAKTLLGTGVDLGAFADATFDLVYAYVAFQHMPRPVFASYLREAHRVLVPDGLLLFQAFVGPPADPPFDDTISLRVYAPAELEHALAEAGFAPAALPPLGSSAENAWVSTRRAGPASAPSEVQWQTRTCSDEASPLDVHLQRHRAEALLRCGDVGGAARGFASLVAYDPDQLAAWLMSVSLDLELGRTQEACASLAALIRHHPHYLPARDMLAQLEAVLQP
jgi:SAM-dependent methyltransferase